MTVSLQSGETSAENTLLSSAAYLDRVREADILLIDDNALSLTMLRMILSKSGYQNLRLLSDPRLVEKAIEEKIPDLILLDLNMPDIDGFEILELIRTKFSQAIIPVIVVTGMEDDASRHKALSLGARDYITKPVNAREVRLRCQNCLEARVLYRDNLANETIMDQFMQERARLIEAMAKQHPVTGLLNRGSFINEICLLPAGESRALLFLRVDHTERIAELFGLGALESLLRNIADLIRDKLPPNAHLGSWSATDFIILVAERTSGQGLRVAETIHSLFAEPINLEEASCNAVNVNARVGISATEDTPSARLIQRAAMALPPLGSALSCRLFSPDIEAGVKRRYALAEALREALKNDELSVVYQPKIHLRRGTVVGAEALMRWHHPEFGHISPMEFIPIAEETGLIEGMGAWILRKAAAQCAQWLSQAIVPADFITCINVAAHQLETNHLTGIIHDVLQVYDLDGANLDFEVTETTLMQDISQSLNVLKDISSLGCGIAIDDFGTGYSSLSYLERLPATALKIDRSFVSRITSHTNDQIIIKAIIAMGRELGLKLIGEGVETKEQADFLLNAGCEIAQGYLFARPLSPADFEQFLRKGPTV